MRQARALAAAGRYAEARSAYLVFLRAAPDCLPALVELGALAEADGFVGAAGSAFGRAAALDPANAVARTGLGNLLLAREEYALAKPHYLAALTASADFAPAHQGLARCLSALGQAGAEAHFTAGFAAHAVLRPRASPGARLPILLLAAARGGNVPCKSWIDPEMFSVTTIYADFFDARSALPPHRILLNAIGDAELCGTALRRAGRIARRSSAPVINPPDRVGRTSRRENAEYLRRIPNVVTPQTRLLRRRELREARLDFPLLLRSPGCHTGRNFLRVESPAELDAAVAALPGAALLAIAFLDARAPDGLFRKYRAMFIDGRIYPLHLAAAADWKVHYFTSDMAERPELRAQEQAFLADMPAAIGARAMAALGQVQAALGLDYAGVDFALDKDGAVIVFEANATMTIHPPDARAIWDYRRPAIGAAQEAVRAMLARKTGTASVDFLVR